ncbi:hypothetical protein DWX43_12430 [Clostridium sp. AF19-22AC]|jgi:glycosyltransferase involved in cell wall biosynthesis|nr:hypothetical protein DWX43_12430 [Clostridium sp. AF19-22AC]
MVMLYLYPKLSNLDCGIVRLGGSGLGNLLFTYSKAAILADELGADLIFPTWPSIKIGPWLRKEKDKRFYSGLFRPSKTQVAGFNKLVALTFCEKIKNREEIKSGRKQVYIYDECSMTLSDILDKRDFVNRLIASTLHPKNNSYLTHDFKNEINIHIRLGDFSRNYTDLNNVNCVNTSTPIDWYVDVVKIINKECPGISFNIFSDGKDEELEALIKIPNVRQITFGNSISDILALSRSKIIIASGSTFSLWARYLGNCSCIAHLNQTKENVCTDENGFEYEWGGKETFDIQILNKITEMYSLA